MKSKPSPVLGVGTDIIEVERIRSSIATHKARFLNRIFTQKEQSYCLKYKDPAPHFASRFAAKEAAVKAFGVGIGKEVSWLDLEILNEKKGKPIIHLSSQIDAAFSNPTLLLSMSHCQLYATATVVWVS